MSDSTNHNKPTENLIIIGSGPAGYTAAIYAARAGLKPLLLEGFMAGGVAAGGQLTTTTEVENFPGFPDGIMGPELMERMRAQAVKHGTNIKTETVNEVDLRANPKVIKADGGDYLARAVIIATGATARRMALPGEDKLWQRGISACAVCDGALPVFRDKPLVVVGGGDSACEEALYLTRFASTVYLVVRRDTLRASKAMQERTTANPKIKILWNHEPLEALGEKSLRAVKVVDNAAKRSYELEAAGLFYAIGHVPNTAFLKGQLPLDDTGYLLTTPDRSTTVIPGVFAAGDVKDKVYRQAVSAAGSGCQAALEAERWLAEEGAK